MPRDDWAKYARRDRGLKALRSGNYERVEKPVVKKQKPKKKKRRKKKKSKPVVNSGEFVIEYNGPTPETSTIRIIKSGPLHKGLPPWPGFGQ